MMNKIENPPEKTGRYLVYYLPYKGYNSSSWQFAMYDVKSKKWYMYIETTIEYRLTHWDFIPDNPPETECGKGIIKGYGIE